MSATILYYFVISLLSICFIIFFYFFLKNRFFKKKIEEKEKEANRIIKEAERQAENLLKESQVEAKSKLLEMKNKFDIETKEAREEIRKEKDFLSQKSENIERKIDRLEKRSIDVLRAEKSVKDKEYSITNKIKNYETLIDETKKQLEIISGFTVEEAKKELMKKMEDEARLEAAKQAKIIINEVNETADKKAKKIIANAIQRYSSSFVAEKTVSVIHLPSEEMKGRIIGREGRNIRSIEAATGIDIIIDDTPEAIVLSGFNPIGREVARIAIEKLITDGRIHPARIESVVDSVRKELEIVMMKTGEEVLFDLGIHGVHNELIKKLGSLKYRTSYSQNILQHSIEVANFCGVIASELGLNVKIAKRMGLLHDIGKSIDYEVEGPHAVIGAKLAKKYGESAKIVYAIEAHHEDVPPESVYDVIVQASDSLSGARPGARKESMENYIKRIEAIESISKTFKGVENSYAIQAGRELRVIVEGSKISDEGSLILSQEIAKKIEGNLSFPGQIKVTVIREMRSISYANKK